MASTTKKGSKNKNAKLSRPVVKTSVAKQAQTNAELRQQLAECMQRESATAKELQDSREQQTATSEILGVIASSPTDTQPVLNVVAETGCAVQQMRRSIACTVTCFGWQLRMAPFPSSSLMKIDPSFVVCRLVGL